MNREAIAVLLMVVALQLAALAVLCSVNLVRRIRRRTRHARKPE